MRDDCGPPAFFDHHPVAAFVVLEIGPIAVPGPGRAIVAERGLAVRHGRIGRADHGVSAGRCESGCGAGGRSSAWSRKPAAFTIAASLNGRIAAKLTPSSFGAHA